MLNRSSSESTLDHVAGHSPRIFSHRGRYRSLCIPAQCKLANRGTVEERPATILLLNSLVRGNPGQPDALSRTRFGPPLLALMASREMRRYGVDRISRVVH